MHIPTITEPMKYAVLIFMFSAISFTTGVKIYKNKTQMISTLSIDSAVIDSNYVQARLKITKQAPACLQMYYNIEKYAKMYSIPRRYAYGIAYAETRYEGPHQWEYDHKQTSSAGAIGPMQIMPTTADMVWPEKNISRKELKNSVKLNVETSMKLLRQLHDKYGDWKRVFGCYNTGRPCINNYAKEVYAYQISFVKPISY